MGLQLADACLFACAAGQAEGSGRATVTRVGFGIPCILLEENTCLELDINQLFQELRNGFSCCQCDQNVQQHEAVK